MRNIVQGLNQMKNNGENLSVELRGQQIDPNKIQRWQKKHGRMKDIARPFPRVCVGGESLRRSYISSARSNRLSLAASSGRILSNTDKLESPVKCAVRPTLNLPTEVTEPSRATDESKSQALDHWGLVDIPGSPLLTRLFEGLKIECESTIPPLDLASSSPAAEMSGVVNPEEWIDFSTGAYSKDLVRYSREVFQGSDTLLIDSNPGLTELSFSEWSFREWDFSRGQPLKMKVSHIFGLSPFPELPENSQRGTPEYKDLSPYARSQALKDKEIKCTFRLNRWIRFFGKEDPRTLVAMQDLGSIYYEQDKCKKAEKLYWKIAKSYKDTHGLKHVKTLSAYLDVVNILYCQAERLKARELHQRIHDTIIKLVDQDDQLALRSNSHRSGILYDIGQLDEADKLIRQTFQIRMHTLGPRHEDTLYDMKVLASTLKRCSKLAESEQLLRISSQLYREVEGPFSARFLDNIHRLAVVLSDQGRYDECKSLSMTVAEHSGILIGQDHHNTLYNHFLVAVCTRKQGDLSESEYQLRSILERQIKSLGEEDPDTCDVLRELSGVLGDMGRYSEAVTLLEKSYKGLTKSLGINHRNTLGCCRDLGDSYEKLGRYEDAIVLLQRIVDDARSPGERPTIDLLKTISKLADIFRNTACFIEAIPLYEECFQEFFEIRGLSDHCAVDTIDNLGLCYEESKRYDDALDLYQRSIDQIRSLEGEEHPALVDISKWMTQLRETLAASAEEADESQDDSDRLETSGVDEALINEGNANTDQKLAEWDVSLAEVDWMGELFDFDLLENHLSKRIDSDIDAQVDET